MDARQCRIGIGLLYPLIAAGALCVVAIAQVSGGNDITLKKADGARVLIQASGPRFNESAHEAAREVETFDREIKNSRKQPGSRDVVEAMRQIAIDARNDAVDSLDLAYRVAEQTSGILDSEQLDSARHNIQFAKDILKASPPPKLYVRTKISSTAKGATIHCWDAADYKKKVGTWSSYTAGESLHIGRYLFRVQPGDGNEPFQELVLVLSDPTEKTLSPVR